MKFIDRLEKKWGRYAIPRLMLYISIAYAVGYVLYMTGAYGALDFLSLNAEKILHGQVWRIFTYIIQPPTSSMPIFFLITLYFYYMIGSFLERQWGAFKFNVYFFSGMFLNVIAAIVIFLVFKTNLPMSVYYLNMSLFMAFAVEQPDTFMMLFFIIPFKTKWFAIIDAIYFAVTVVTGYLSMVVQLPLPLISVLLRIGIVPAPTAATAALIAMLNFLIFFFVIRAGKKATYTQKNFRTHTKEKSQSSFAGQTRDGAARIARHRCAICGKTEFNDANEEFRFCTKCAGAFEYCSAHLHNHNHVYRDSEGNLKRD